MVLTTGLLSRSNGQCELCSATTDLTGYTVAPKTGKSDDDNIAVCPTCLDQLEGRVDHDPNHWRCLNDSMWSSVPAVQVTAYRLLNNMSDQDWAIDAAGMMYMDDETREWADSASGEAIIHKDANGHVLQQGDNVTLIQDLNVKGASFTAKRGTAVRKIRLVRDNAAHIEGKIDGQTIVILTKYVKKS